MKLKGYPKEQLTLKNIRSDLRKKLWKEVLLLLLAVVCVVSLIYLVVNAPEFLFHRSGRRGKPGWLSLLLLPYMLYVTIKKVWLVSCGFRRRPYIVRDTLVSAESDSDISVNTYQKRDYCTLHFSRYGDYAVPQKNHTWSKLYPLSCMGEYYHASEGDEYYLVLSKPHSGKILLAYNTKMFTLEETKP